MSRVRLPNEKPVFCKKVTHFSKEAATVAMHRVVDRDPQRHKRKAGRKSKRPEVYYCATYCGWHWGHTSWKAKLEEQRRKELEEPEEPEEPISPARSLAKCRASSLGSSSSSRPGDCSSP